MVSLTARARCLRCPWATEGDPDKVDKAAEKHVAVGHPTAAEARPVPGGAA